MFATRFGIAIAAAILAIAGAEAQTPAPPAASDFAAMAAQSDDYEIQAGRDALTQAADPRVRAFAQEMVDAHTRTSQNLRSATAAANLSAPQSAISGDQARLLSALQSLRGAEFDRTYIRQQVLAHNQALAVTQNYASAGAEPNLRGAAQATLPVIKHHLEMAEQLRAALGGDGY
jgi:putative membrane protein